MDDASRQTWSRVFLTLGGTMAIAAITRWARWHDHGGAGDVPQVLWTLGALAVGFLLVSAQLRAPVWARRWAASQAEEERQRNDWVDQ